MKPGVLRGYSKGLKKVHEAGATTEYSYRIVFQEFLRSLFSKEYNVRIIHEPSRETFGAPDFKISTETGIIGYIETKVPNVDLHRLPKRDKSQIKRYSERLDNFILTNYRDFILYQRGEKVEEVSLLDEDFNLIESNVDKFNRLIQRFLSFTVPKIKDPEELAYILAKRAMILKDVVLENMNEDEQLQYLYQAFKEHLMSGMKKSEFADAYAQTVVYGLFMARFMIEGQLTRENVAFRGVPKSLRVVHEIFKYIASDLPDYLEWILEELIAILNNVDVEELKRRFHFGNGEFDPFLHFYETFLAEYSPNLRKSKGVYYTPIPVVEFIVNSVDEILKEKFGKRLQDDGVTILDPATGTGTFLAGVLDRIHRNIKGTLFQLYLKERLLNNIYGFEILISPYLVAHLKLSMVLNQWGIKLKDDERFKIYLTNALDLMRERGQAGLFERALDKESEEADRVKKETKIFVVIGNPPYESKKIEESWGSELLKEYLHGLSVEQEKNKGVIQDYYIGFIRFAQWKIDQNGKGIVGFITNNSYLDGIIHRRMRQSLMESFDEIYILNLHGNANRGEQDDNVFKIKQGVAIALFVKLREGKHKAEECKIYYYSIVHDAGKTTREEKYEFLRNKSWKTVEWKELEPKEPYYFFVPKDLSLEGEYSKFPKLDEIFEVYSSGVETGKDSALVAFSKEDLEPVIRDILNPKVSTAQLREKYDIESTSGWRFEERRAKIVGTPMKPSNFKKLAYRPFDWRWVYYEPKILRRAHFKVMKHFLADMNIGIVTERIVPKMRLLWDAVFVVDTISELHLTGSKSYIFPLYLYSDDGKTRRPNLKPEFLEELRKRYGEITPEDFLYYAYAVLHDPKYRKRYAEFLKFDFPRIPLYEGETFKRYRDIGEELVKLHLMKVDFPVEPKLVGDDLTVEKVKYDGKDCVAINKTTKLCGIPPEVWEYTIGGYRVIEKYLKGRKGRKLSLDELEHIYKVVEILRRTIGLVKELEAIEPKF
ncbi:type ISP restriction/modification enzyme [Thermococcus gorgonarius]|uniref:site-specific DNA-methyltransferase (adenine-specific) n=1 Tax=Thermococcus gorgonarius TaxID=71997 RepID=A0A2Z2M3A3_THEGO|nr:type ISP restriction/modification enzyme [Thermococcus gorgonarius]ASJ00027.1 N-6 DNA methylase [Thermococcus gorgonarius]